MRILVRTSKWAIWARRFGSFALPLGLIPVLMHRAGVIETPTFAVVEAFAIGFAGLALLLSLCAFARIWVTGDHGWGRAVAGLIFSLICMVPLGFFGFEYLHYPTVDGVSTDPADPPPLVSSAAPSSPSPAAMAAVSAAFPNLKSRSYPLDARRTFDLVNRLVMERQWDVKLRREPTEASAGGQINAIATTLFGFRDEVSIRIGAMADGSSVDMRSVSLTAMHEPGVNGSRIEEFLTALDNRVTVLMKDEPAGSDADDTDADADQTPVVPAPAPPPRGRKR